MNGAVVAFGGDDFQFHVERLALLHGPSQLLR